MGTIRASEKKRIYSPQVIETLRQKEVPRHVAIIMDGNRRWEANRLKKKMFFGEEGHWAGAHVLIEGVQAAQEMGIKVLTVYAFSTENWSRSPQEVTLLFKIFEVYLHNHLQQMIDEGVRFDVIGAISLLSPSLQQLIYKAKEGTKEGKTIDFVVALNYGSRDEIKRAIVNIAEDCMQKKIRSKEISEELIARYLDTAEWGDPDLLIRTSGELRLSNFMLWQLAYTEIYVTDVLWPDFTPYDFLKAVESFQQRERRLGR